MSNQLPTPNGYSGPSHVIPSPDVLRGPKFEVESDDITRTITRLGYALPGSATEEQLAANAQSEASIAVEGLGRMMLENQAVHMRNIQILEALHAYDQNRLKTLVDKASQISDSMDKLMGKRNPIQSQLSFTDMQLSMERERHEQLNAGLEELQRNKAVADEQQRTAFDTLLGSTERQNFADGHAQGVASARFNHTVTQEEFEAMQLQGEGAYTLDNFKASFVETDSRRQEREELEVRMAEARQTLDLLAPHLVSLNQSIGAQNLSIVQTESQMDQLLETIELCKEGLLPLDETIQDIRQRLKGLKLEIFEIYKELSERRTPTFALTQILRTDEGQKLLLSSGASALEQEVVQDEVLDDYRISDPQGEILDEEAVENARRAVRGQPRHAQELVTEPRPAAQVLGNVIGKLKGFRNKSTNQGQQI